jgi:hypothetical protein
MDESGLIKLQRRKPSKCIKIQKWSLHYADGNERLQVKTKLSRILSLFNYLEYDEPDVAKVEDVDGNVFILKLDRKNPMKKLLHTKRLPKLPEYEDIYQMKEHSVNIPTDVWIKGIGMKSDYMYSFIGYPPGGYFHFLSPKIIRYSAPVCASKLRVITN